MMDPALVAAVTALITALAGYVKVTADRQKERAKENADDLNAVFPKVRALETRLATLESKLAFVPEGAPTCLTTCQRKEVSDVRHPRVDEARRQEHPAE